MRCRPLFAACPPDIAADPETIDLGVIERAARTVARRVVDRAANSLDSYRSSFKSEAVDGVALPASPFLDIDDSHRRYPNVSSDRRERARERDAVAR